MKPAAWHPGIQANSVYFSQKTVFLEFRINSFTGGLGILFQKIYQKIIFNIRVPLSQTVIVKFVLHTISIGKCSWGSQPILSKNHLLKILPLKNIWHEFQRKSTFMWNNSSNLCTEICLREAFEKVQHFFWPEMVLIVLIIGLQKFLTLVLIVWNLVEFWCWVLLDLARWVGGWVGFAEFNDRSSFAWADQLWKNINKLGVGNILKFFYIARSSRKTLKHKRNFKIKMDILSH